jgi:membrane-associated protease RseP (regulator of RpoE activity)
MSDPINPKAYEVQGIAHLLQANNDGDDGAKIDDDYRRMMRDLSAHLDEYGGAPKAKMTITIEVTVDNKGTDVSITSKATTPVRPKSKARYFVNDKGDGLTLMNPNKDTMFPGVNLGRRRQG